MTLYLLYHKRFIDENYYDTKIIGIYSTLEKATHTIKNFSHLPGFSEFYDGFCIETFSISRKYINKKKIVVYLLIGVRTVNLDEIIVSYNVYFNLICATFISIIKKIKIDKLANKFYIDRYLVDRDNWKEGFVIIEE